jgi:hypothetical protein
VLRQLLAAPPVVAPIVPVLSLDPPSLLLVSLLVPLVAVGAILPGKLPLVPALRVLEHALVFAPRPSALLLLGAPLHGEFVACPVDGRPGALEMPGPVPIAVPQPSRQMIVPDHDPAAREIPGAFEATVVMAVEVVLMEEVVGPTAHQVDADSRVEDQGHAGMAMAMAVGGRPGRRPAAVYALHGADRVRSVRAAQRRPGQDAQRQCQCCARSSRDS